MGTPIAGGWVKQGSFSPTEFLLDANGDGRVLLIAVLSVITVACPLLLCALFGAAGGSSKLRNCWKSPNRSISEPLRAGSRQGFPPGFRMIFSFGALAHRLLAELAMFIHTVASAMAIARRAFAGRTYCKQSPQQLLLFGRAIQFATDGDYWRNWRQKFGDLRLFAAMSAADNKKPQVEITLARAAVVMPSHSQIRASLNGSVIAGDVLAGWDYDFASEYSEEANLLGAMAGEGFPFLGAAHLPTQRMHQPWENFVPTVQSSVQKFDHSVWREAACAGDSCEIDFGDVLLVPTCDKKLADTDTNAALWGLNIKGRNFLRGSASAVAQSLLSCFSSFLTDIRRGSGHLTPGNYLVKGDMQVVTNRQILFVCTISYNLITVACAQDRTENGKPVDSEVWQTNNYAKAAAMTLLAGSIGGVGVAVWIIFNRRRTFTVDDINEGLMRGPAVVRLDDPNFAIHPPIESDEE